MKKLLIVLLLSVPALAASVTLKWNPLPVPNSTCGPANFINVYRSDSSLGSGIVAPPGGATKIASLPGNTATTYTDSTVVDNHTYFYSVSAYVNPPCGGPNGAESVTSNEVQAVVGQAVKVYAPPNLSVAQVVP